MGSVMQNQKRQDGPVCRTCLVSDAPEHTGERGKTLHEKNSTSCMLIEFADHSALPGPAVFQPLGQLKTTASTVITE